MPVFGPINYGYYGRIRWFFFYFSQQAKEKLHKEMANKTYRFFTHFLVAYENNSEFLAGLDQVSVCLFIV